MRRLILLSLLAVFAATAVCAQEATKNPTKPKDTAATQESPVPTMPKPSPEIEKLAKLFNGRWNVSGNILDEMWVKGGDEGSGFEVTRSGPGGFTYISDSTMNFKRFGPMLGHGVVWYDESKKAFQGMWCDNGGPTCMSPGDGKWEGDKLVFLGDMPIGTKTVPVRQTYRNFTENSFEWFMETGDGQGNWKPEMSLKYQRADEPNKEAQN